jgi:hypothetical protein
MTTDLQGGQIRPRLVAMYLLVTVMLLAMLLRTGYLQTIGSGKYREASFDQRTRIDTVRAERGSILDRQGLELALPVPTRTVYADPTAIIDPIATARAIAGILQITPEEEIALVEKLQSKGNFIFIARQAPQEVSDAIIALQLPGISSYRETSRAITSEGLRALVGRTDPDGVGIAGLEILFNDTLTGIESVIGSAFGDLFQLSLTPGWNVNGGSGGYDVVALANGSGTVTSGMLQGVLGNIDEIDFTGTGVDGSLTIGSSFIQSVVGTGTGSQLTIKLDGSDSLTIESGSFYQQAGNDYTFYSDGFMTTEVARLSVSG